MVNNGPRAFGPASRCRGDTVGESTQKKQGAVVSPLDLDQISGIHTEVLRAFGPAQLMRVQPIIEFKILFSVKSCKRQAASFKLRVIHNLVNKYKISSLLMGLSIINCPGSSRELVSTILL